MKPRNPEFRVVCTPKQKEMADEALEAVMQMFGHRDRAQALEDMADIVSSAVSSATKPKRR